MKKLFFLTLCILIGFTACSTKKKCNCPAFSKTNGSPTLYVGMA